MLYIASFDRSLLYMEHSNCILFLYLSLSLSPSYYLCFICDRGYHGHLKSLRAISYHPLAVVKGQKRPDNVHLVS